MAKSVLYTGTGDHGMTSLVGGKSVKKNCCRLSAYGTIDELSSVLGLLVACKECPENIKEILTSIQNELFNIGGYLATQFPPEEEIKCKSLGNGKIREIETTIDSLDEQTPKIRAFILPGGCEAAARAHLARVVCRRAERCVLDLADETYVDSNVLIYLNRLSDLLFIIARNINHTNGYDEIKWKQ